MWEIKGKDNQTKAIPSTKPEYNGEWMGESYVTVSVESPAPVNFEIGDYIIYRDERFEINYDPGKIKSAPRYEKGDAFKYESIKFNSLADELTRCDFLDVVLEDNQLHFTGLPKFSFYGGVRDLANRMQANLDRTYGKGTWHVVVSPEYSGTKEVNISVDTIKVQGALSILVNDLETYYTIKGRTITIGAAGVPAGHLFKYGKGNGLYGLEENAETDQAIVTRLRAYGSTRNLPHRYYNSLSGADGQKLIPDNMAVQYLMLPSFPYTTQDPYIDSANKAKLGIREGTVFFDGTQEGLDEIYPSIEGMTAEQLTAAGVPCNSTGALDEIVSAEQITDNGVGEVDGNETKPADGKNTFKVVLKDLGFDIWEHRIAGTAPVLSFKTGMLGGRDFEIVGCKKIETGGKVTGYELELNRVYDDGIQLWFPYSSYNAKAGDKIVILHIEMPEVYIKAAAQRVLEAATEWLSKNDYSRSIYAPKIDEIFMARQHDLAMASGGKIKSLHDTLKEGMLLLFEDEDLNIDASIFIDRLTIKEEGTVPTYEVVLKEEKTVGRLDKMQNQIDSLAAGKGQGGGGYTASQIRSLISAYGGSMFLSKLKDDRSKGQIASDMAIEVGNYLAGVSGAKIGKDAETGQTFGEMDRLFVRIKAYFETLTIINAESLAGEQRITPGGGVKCTSVEVLGDVYRCYFLSEQDGEKTETKIVVGDQAISEMFNAKTGTDNKVSNHRYWRLVTAVSNDAYTDDSGNHYGYIDLSKTDCENGSSVPQAGDDIVQFGNRNDRTRQAAMVFSTVDADAPSIKLFSGINSYTLDNKDVVSYGYDSAKGNAYFNCYGDTYIGDRNGSTYIKYDQINKQLDVKAKLSLLSTVGDKTINEFVSDAAKAEAEKAKAELQANIDILQNQMDGVIESFNGLGAPTLTNYPANEWTTDEERRRHDRDIYTDITPYVDDETTPTSGQSWKWYYNSPTDYGWVKIADSDAVRALQLAKMSVRDTDVLYISHASQTDAPALPAVNADGVITDAKGWQTSAPAWSPTMYIWQTTYVRKGDGNAYFSDPTCISGYNGKDGDAGNGIDRIDEYYATGSSDSAPPASWQKNPSKIPVPTAQSRYLWNYEEVTYTSGGSFSTEPRVLGMYSEDGEDGRALVSSTEYYLATADGNNAPVSGWKTKYSEAGFSETNRYLWNYEVSTYTKAPLSVSSAPRVIGVWGQQGQRGLQGIQGPQGEQGIPGVDGATGKTSYFHIKYSAVPNPTSASQMTETPSTYIGTYVDFTAADSTDPSKYAWARFQGLQGEDGSQGIPGKNGEDGRTSYLHIKYSNDGGKTLTLASGGLAIGETPGDYIGQYTDFEPADSTDPSKYKWSKIKGEDGTSVTISSTEVRYSTAYNSSTQPADATFTLTAVPSLSAGQYLWCRTRVMYSNGQDTTSYAVSRIGVNGTSVTIKSTSVTYAKSATPAQPADSAFTYTSIGALGIKVGEYMWTKTEVVYSDNTPVKSYTVSRVGSDGTDGTPGAPGKDGRTTYVHYAYANSADGKKDFSTTYFDDALYVGVCTDYSQADPTTYSSYEWSRLRGEDGRGIVSTTEYYAVSPSNTTAPADNAFSTTVPVTTPTNRYLWNYEVTTYSNNTTKSTQKRVIGTHGENGNDGAGISAVTNYYLASDKDSGVTTSTAGWTTDASKAVTTDQKPYLWNYEKITYTKGNPTTTTPHIIGKRGVGVKSIVEQYYLSTSRTVLSGGAWSYTRPEWKAGHYYWTRSEITYTDGKVEYTAGICVTGESGTSVLAEYSSNGTSWHPTFVSGDIWMRTSNDGGVTWSPAMKIVGQDGTNVTVSSTSVSYQASSNGTTAPTGTWSATIPSVAPGQFLWTRTTVAYSNGKSTTTYSVSRQGVNGSDGKDGTSVTIVSTEVRYAKGNYPTQPADTAFTLTSIGALTKGQWLWTRTTVVYSDNNTPVKSYTAAYIGSDGDVGTPGAPGENGKTTYVHFAYASGITGSLPHPTAVSGFSTSSFAGAKYIGVCTDYTPSDPTANVGSTYEWSEYKGADGQYRKFQWALGTATAVTGTWQDAPMNAAPGQYVWMRSGIVTPPATAPGTWETATRLTGDKGADGQSVYMLDLSNEVMGVLCDASGKVTGKYETSQASVYKGSTKLTSGVTYKIAQASGASATISSSGVVTISALTADNATITVQAEVDGVVLTSVISVYKVYAGADGQSAVMYSITPSVDNISRSMTGTLSVSNVTCSVYKTTGSSARVLSNDHTLTYQRLPDGATGTLSRTGGVSGAVSILADTEAVIFELKKGSTVLDRERVPVLSDASDLEIGGRNLLLASGTEHVTGNYNIARYDLTTPPAKGDSCVFTLWGQLASTKTDFQIFNSGGMVRLGILKKIDDGVYQVKFTWTNGEGTANEVTPTYINLYHMANSQSGTSTVLRVKLEKGNAATDWTPAPEDIDSRVDTFDYLKEALKGNTVVDGGLVMSSLIKLGTWSQATDPDKATMRKTYAGMNGLYVNDKTIASWWGGDMIDREHLASGQSIANAATALVRMDGTGYFAKGNISWNSDGSGSVAGGKLRWDANGNVTLGAGVTVAGGDGVSNTTLTSLLQFINGINQLIVPVDANGNELPYDKLTNSDGTTKIKAVKAKFDFYSVGGVTALGMGSITGGGSGTGGGASALIDLLDVKLTNLAKGQMLQYNGTHWVNISGIATESYVNTRINAIVNGAPAAYDTLKEIADVLQGNVNSIGDIMTALGNKADKTQLANYVTLGTAQTITGVKTFSAKTVVSDYLHITSSQGHKYILIGNQDSGGANKPFVIRGSNANLYLGRGNNWNDNAGGTFTQYAQINSSGITAIAFIKSGGTATQVLMADGTVQTHWKAADVTSATSDTGMITPLAMNQWTTKTFVTALGTSGNYLTWTKNGVVNNITVPFATTSQKLGTATVGSGVKPMYLNAGTPTASASTVGAANRPVYMNSGTITAGTYTFDHLTAYTHYLSVTSFTPVGTDKYICITTPTWHSQDIVLNLRVSGSNTYADCVIHGGCRSGELWGWQTRYNSGCVTGVSKDTTTSQISFYIRLSSTVTSVVIKSSCEVTVTNADYSTKTFIAVPTSGLFGSSFTGGDIKGTSLNISGTSALSSTLTVGGLATFNGGVTIPTGKKLTIGTVTIEYDASNHGLKVSGGGLYTDSYLSALGIGSVSGSTGGSSYDRLDNWGDYTSAKEGYVLSAKLGYSLYQDVSSLKSGAAVSVTTTGAGNAVTAVTKSGTVITATKGATFLTSHQSLTHLLKVDGTNGTAAGVSTLINKLSVGSSNPMDADYYVSQYAGGGTTTTTYHRRPMSALWNYIKSKTDANYVTLATAQTITAKKIFQAGLQANWAFIQTGDPTLKIYSGKITDAKSDGNICLQTSIDSTDGETHTYPTAHGARCNLVLQPRGGQVYVGTNPDGGNSAYKLYVNGSSFATSFVKSGGTASQLLMADGSVTTKKTATAQTNSGWNGNATDDLIIPTMSFIAHWNGRYSATASNLAYCNKGAFGDIVTHAHSEYVTALGTNGNHLTWTRNGAVSNITVPYATNADTLDGQHGAYYQSRVYDAVVSQYNTYDYIEFLRCVIPAGTTSLRDYIVFDLTRVETGAAQCARVVLRIRRASDNTATFSFYASNFGSIAIPELKVTSDDGITYKVWVKCVKANYDPYLAVKIVESYVYGHWSLVNNGMTGTPAGTKYNVTCATAGIASKLAVTRTLWGRPFDGSDNVSGALTSVTNITMTGSLKIGEATISYDNVNHCLKVDKGFYSESFVSALGLNPGSGGGGGIIEKVYGSKSLGGTFSDSTLTDTFNAYTINAINTRLKTVETGGAMSVATTGSGNAVTAITKSGTVITVTKGATFLTAHQSLANYVTLNTAQTITAQKTSGRPASSWYNGRDNALFRVTRGVNSSYYPLFSIKTQSGSWEVGNHTDELLLFTHISDANYNAGTNVPTTQIKFNSNGSVTAASFIKSGGTSSQFLKADGSVDSTAYATAAQLTNGSVTKIGTATVGSTSKPVYLNAGVPTALSATVGSGTKPVYLNAGTVTASSSTVGSGVKPMYLNAGTMTASSSTVGGTAKPVWLNAGTVTALSATAGANNLPVYLNGGTLTAVTSVGEAYLSWGGKSLAGSISPVDCAASALHSANRLAFANPAGITIEYSRNGGSTWTDYGLSDAAKTSLVSGLSQAVYIGGKSTDVTVSCRLRITLNATKMGLYTRARKLLFNISTNGASGASVLVERAMKGSETTFITEGTYAVSGWSGWNSIPLSGLGFGGGDTQTGNAAVYRLTFFITGLSSNTSHSNALNVIDLVLIGDTYWATPHEMAKSGHLYTYDSSKNATFPAKVTAASFSGSLSGNASTATTLQTARSINGTNFNGSANITTANWGTARNIGIVNSDGTGTAVVTSVNGSANINLKLPATIKAALTGNASTATALQTARTIWGQSFNGGANISGNMTGVGSITGSGVLTLIGTGDIYLKNGNTDSRSLVLNSSAFKPFDAANGLLNLGTASARWNGIYGKTLNLTDVLSSSKASGTYLAGNQGQAIINSTASSGSYAMLVKMNSTNGVFTHGVYQTRYELHYTAATTVSAGTNNVSNNTTLMDENGNMGIGTTAPSYKLHVAGTLYASGAASLASTLAVTGNITHSAAVLPAEHNTLRLGSETRNYAGVHSRQFINNTDGAQMWIWQAKNNPLGFATNGVERMRIAAAGNVGIGTASPAYLLDVNGGVNCASLRVASASGAVLHNSATADYILAVTAKDKSGNWFTAYQINHDKGFVFPANVPVYAHSTLTIGTKSTLSWDSSGNALKCNTNFYSTGGITALSTSSTSDMRLKEIVRDMVLDVRAIASAPSFVHRWKDAAAYGCGEYAGSSAQYWLKVLPQVVGGRQWLALDYGKAALLSAIALARRSENHEQRISRLEKENESLRRKCMEYENELKGMRK